MAHRQVKVIGKRAAWASQFKVETLKGRPLIPSGSIATQYVSVLDKHIDAMIREVKREVIAMIEDSDGFEDAHAMDASIASQTRILFNAFGRKFDKLFKSFAMPLASNIVDKVNKDSAVKLGISLKEMSGNYTLKTDILNDSLRDVLKASVEANVDLITSISSKYLNDVQGAVMRSIQTGNGLADLVPALDKYGVTTRNWAKNVAMDQTRKAYNGINKGRMQAMGVKKFEWMHSGGSAYPREYHRDELNGKIFSFDDLPVIDLRTKETGIPGQLPYCRCSMRPVFDFGDDEVD